MPKEEVNVFWDEIHQMTATLAEQIKNAYQVDNIVSIARGGVVPARYIAKFLDIRKLYSIGIEFYNGDSRNKIPKIYQGLTQHFGTEDVTLIVDDVVDSGTSMLVAIKEVEKTGAKNIITCSLHYKKISKFKPDFYGVLVPDNIWLKYDWE